MLAYPSPRAAVLGIFMLGVASAGYFWRAAFELADWLLLLLLLVMALDLLLTTNALRGKLVLTRELPHSITVTRAAPGFHIVANRSRIPLRVQVFEDTLPHLNKEFAPYIQRVAPGATVRWDLRVSADRRGERDLGGAALRVSAGLGLWVLQYRYALHDRVRVYPLIEELTRGDLFAHRRRLYAIGQHSSRKFGRGTEFDRLREYTPDDEYRQINWKATARRGVPVVNQMQVEQSRDLILLLDCGRLMHTEIAGRPRLDRYLDAAVHLSYLALSQRDRVGLIAFDAELRRFIPPARRPRQLEALIDAMFDLQPRYVESDYGRAIAELRSRSPKRGMVVLFTDLLDSVSSRSAVAQLSRLARTHLPVVAILDDPAIPALAEQPAQREEDAFVKSAAEKFIGEKLRALTQLRTRGCLIVNVAAERLNVALVSQYLEVKARNML